MRCKCKVLSVDGVPASDGSIVPYEVMNSYINSEECQEALRYHKMIGSLTHRSRSVASSFPDAANSSLTKTIGKDDSLIIVSEQAPTPTHYIDALYIEDGWLWCEIETLKEEGMDDLAIQNIRRLTGMLKNGILPGVSAVIVGYWQGEGGGKCDVLQKCVALKGIDVTLNPSWKAATITEVLEEEKTYSEKTYSKADYAFDGVKVKTFSDLGSLGINAPKSSKINGVYTKLAAKVFSANGVVEEIAMPVEKKFSAMSVNERVKIAQLSPRERFRRLILDYRQALKAQGGIQKIKPEALNAMKSLFTGDVLNLMSVVTPMVLQGKNLVTVLGAGSLGVQVRKACQAMMIPYKQALTEAGKQGFVSKMRYQKIQNAYVEFTKALQDYTFGATPIEMDETEEG